VGEGKGEEANIPLFASFLLDVLATLRFNYFVKKKYQ